jgi:hypothetical protein
MFNPLPSRELRRVGAVTITTLATVASCTTPPETRSRANTSGPTHAAAGEEPGAATSAEFTKYQYERGRISKVGTFSAEDLWKSTVAERIANERAGRRPDATGGISWKQEWQEWYAIIRHYPNPGFKSSEFKTSEDIFAT